MVQELLLGHERSLGSCLISTNGGECVNRLVHLANGIHHVFFLSLEVIIGLGPEGICSGAGTFIVAHCHLKLSVLSAQLSILSLQSSDLASEQLDGYTTISNFLRLLSCVGI